MKSGVWVEGRRLVPWQDKRRWEKREQTSGTRCTAWETLMAWSSSHGAACRFIQYGLKYLLTVYTMCP